MARLRRENTSRPAIFVGAGTCGLGAGAAKTLQAVKTWLNERAVEADVIEVGCIGLCSAEPLMDVQLPGRSRVMFQHVTEENAARCWTRRSRERFRPRTFWDSIMNRPAFSPGKGSRLKEHPFSRPQTRGFWPTVE
jgi:(2Fe-2S) ferredoxin